MNTKKSRAQLEESNPVLIAEYRLLNAIYLNPELLLDSNITEDLLANSSSKSIFNSMVYLYSQDVPFNRNSIFQRAAGIDVNVKINQIEMMIDLNDKPLESVKDIMLQLQNTKNSLNALRLLREAEAEINKHPIRTPESDDKVRSLITQAETAYINTFSINRIETYDDLENDYKKILQERRSGKKYLFGDPILDKYITYGPAPGHIGIIAGSTGSGKSSFVLNLIDRLEKIQVPCFYYSLEMGKIDTMDRKLALRKEIPLSDIVSPPDGSTWEAIDEAASNMFADLKKNKLFRFSESPNVSLSQIKQDVKKFQSDIGKQYCVVVLDLLSMVKEFTVDIEGKNFAQVIEIAINQLNAIAKELGIHIIAVLQMKRKEDRIIDDLKDLESMRPSQNGIKNASAFSERVRWAIALWRPRFVAELFMSDSSLYEDMPDICHVISLKQSAGKVGEFGKGYLFEPEIMKMTPIVEDSKEESEE